MNSAHHLHFWLSVEFEIGGNDAGYAAEEGLGYHAECQCGVWSAHCHTQHSMPASPMTGETEGKTQFHAVSLPGPVFMNLKMIVNHKIGSLQLQTENRLCCSVGSKPTTESLTAQPAW
jgi:hypothetical protein